MTPIRDTSRGATFAVKVHPRTKKNAITGEAATPSRSASPAPAVEDRANQGCIELFANLLKVPRSSATIASGRNSRNKVIRVAGVSADEVRKRLGI